MPAAVNAYKTTTKKVKPGILRKAIIRVSGTTGAGSGYGQTYPKGNKSTN